MSALSGLLKNIAASQAVSYSEIFTEYAIVGRFLTPDHLLSLHMMRWLALFLALLGAGCGMRHIVRADGEKATEIFFGLGSGLNCEAQEGAVATATMAGIWTQLDGGGLGFHRGRYYCGTAACKIVLWAEPSVNAEALRAQLGDLESVCVVE